MANAYITGLATCLNILTECLHNYVHLFRKTQTKKKKSRNITTWQLYLLLKNAFLTQSVIHVIIEINRHVSSFRILFSSMHFDTCDHYQDS